MADAAVHMSPERSHSFHETLEVRLLIEPSVAARAAGSPTLEFCADLDAALERVLAAPTWLQFKEGIYGFSRLHYVEAGDEFLCWTFDQIVTARRANKFDGGADQAPVANLVRKHFHDRLSKIGAAIASGNPERARAEVESFLVGMAAYSVLICAGSVHRDAGDGMGHRASPS